MPRFEAKFVVRFGSLFLVLTSLAHASDASMYVSRETVQWSSAVAAALLLLGLVFILMELRRRTALEANLQRNFEDRTTEIQQLRLALDLAKVAVWTWHASSDSTIWSGPVETVFGRPATQLNTFALFSEHVFPADREMLQTATASALRERRRFQGEFRMILPNGDLRWIAAYGDVICDESGQATHMAGVNMDISERKKVEHKLETSERHFRELAESMPQIVWTAGPSGDLEYQNDRWHLVTGLPKGNISMQDRRRVMHPDDFPRMAELRAESLRTGREYDVEIRIFDVPKQEFRWQWAHALPIRDAAGNVARWFGTFTDIHERKMAEGKLLRLLEEKNTLFHEMHHRVKNNLQVISSLLRLQSETMLDPTAVAALKESHQRVLSMALIHEQLYGNGEISHIDFGDFTQKLVSELFHSYVGDTARVTCRLNTASVYLKIDHAIPLGLILNELTTNALKYAYPNGMTGEVAVDLRETQDRQVTLAISDQGIGLPDGFNWSNSKSMGLPIVDMLTQQLGGQLTIRSKPGATFQVQFPQALESINQISR